MPVVLLNAYLEKLQARKIETKLMMVDVIKMPHLKSDHQKQLIASWMRELNIQDEVKATRVSPSRLKLLGIGVRYVR